MSTPFQYVPQINRASHIGAVLGDQIRAEIIRLRTAKDWSRPQLAAKIKPPTSGQQIERLEKGTRQLDTEWIEKIAKAFGVEPAMLVAGEAQQFELTPQVADEVAETLARIALGGAEPTPAIVQDLSIIVQELSATFVRHPQARRDPQAARPVIDFLARRHGR